MGKMSELERIEREDRESIWWTPKKILSYNCLYNWIVGNRGGGKTFGCKEMCIRKAIENGEEFVYVRRTEVELTHAKKKFFDDIVSEGKFPGYTFQVKGNELQYSEIMYDEETGEEVYEWKQLGYALALSGARKQKSVSFPRVKYIIFDEFIIPNAGFGSYLPDEVTCFLELYETIARMRDVIVLFVSNAVTMGNPYFIYFDLHLPYGSFIGRCGKDKCLEIVNNEAYKEKKRQTRFGQMVAGTDYAEYAIENRFVWDNVEDKLAKLDNNYNYGGNILWNGILFAYYFRNDFKYVLFSNKVDKNRDCLDVQLKNGKVNKIAARKSCNLTAITGIYAAYMEQRALYDTKKLVHVVEDMVMHFM